MERMGVVFDKERKRMKGLRKQLFLRGCREKHTKHQFSQSKRKDQDDFGVVMLIVGETAPPCGGTDD